MEKMDAILLEDAGVVGGTVPATAAVLRDMYGGTLCIYQSIGRNTQIT